MSRRAKSYDKHDAEMMKDLNYAREVLLHSLDKCDLSLEESLKNVIQKMGIKEFSSLSHIPIQNISQFIQGKRNPKRATLDKYLSVFKTQIKDYCRRKRRIEGPCLQYILSDMLKVLQVRSVRGHHDLVVERGTHEYSSTPKTFFLQRPLL